MAKKKKVAVTPAANVSLVETTARRFRCGDMVTHHVLRAIFEVIATDGYVVYVDHELFQQLNGPDCELLIAASDEFHSSELLRYEERYAGTKLEFLCRRQYLAEQQRLEFLAKAKHNRAVAERIIASFQRARPGVPIPPPFLVEQANSYDIFPLLPDDMADVTIADPGYTTEVHASVKSVHDHNTGGAPRVVYKPIDFEPTDPFLLAPQLLRLTKRWVFIFCALEAVGDFKRAAEGYLKGSYIRSGTFRRKNSTPQLSGDRPGQAVEAFVVLHKPGKKHWNGGGRHAFYWHEGPSNMDLFYEAARATGARLHETQKNTGMMMEIIEDFSDEYETIFDPFFGSGTTGDAALRTNRFVVGIDQREKDVLLARDRLSASLRLLELKDISSSQLSIVDAGYKPPLVTYGQKA